MQYASFLQNTKTILLWLPSNEIHFTNTKPWRLCIVSQKKKKKKKKKTLVNDI